MLRKGYTHLTFCNVTLVKKTRKAYACVSCKASIEAGSRCVVESGKIEGEFFSHRMHVECFRGSICK